MSSIQRHLIVWLTVACVTLLVATGAVIYRFFRADVVGQFDRALQTEAQVLSSCVTFDREGHLDFDYSAPASLQRHLLGGPEYFVIRHADGKIFRTYGSAGAALSLSEESIVRDVRLPRGKMGRALRLTFVPQADPDAETEGSPRGAVSSSPVVSSMSIVVARDRSGLDQSLARFLRTLVLAITVLASAVAITVVLVVRQSLRPLQAIARRAGQINPSQLHLRLPTENLPSELRPICDRLNDLLERLAEAFERERRFTSDVAHELRTPIAELRSLAEVALRWPDDSQAARDALGDARHIAIQMQTLVNTLLSLVRAERATTLQLQPVVLADAIAHAIRDLSSRGRGRIAVRVPDDAVVLAEPTLVLSILRNLLTNALEYGDPDAPIELVAHKQDERCALSMQNRTTRLTGEDLPHLFEPFWRKDSARSDSSHVGLGLALVKAYATLMRAPVCASIVQPDSFKIELSFLACTRDQQSEFRAEISQIQASAAQLSPSVSD